MKKAAIATLGCKVNQVESSSIVGQLIEKGYEIVEFDQPADIYIINTCTVTNRTDFKSRSLIRQAHKQKALNSKVKIIVTGCYAQKEIEEIRTLGEVDLIVDNQAKVDLDEWLDNLNYKFTDIMKADSMSWKPIQNMHERTRAFLKIQDGCDYYCSYCAVPYGRGHSRSLDFREVVKQAEILTENGYQEIVLSGVNLGLYQDQKVHKTLADVVKALVEIDKLKLLRLSSIEPDLWKDKLIESIETSEKVCPHFHIPLQSGSDSVLQRMKRRYDSDSVKDMIKRLNSIKPYCAIGLDVISGFPGETEDEHNQTIEFINKVKFTYLHVFSYSKRKGTPAAVMANQINGQIIKQRVTELTALSKHKKEEYEQELIQNKVIVNGIVESVQSLYSSALSDRYIRIYSKNDNLKESDFVCGEADSRYKDGILVKSALGTENSL